jgi:hypothetical protein
LGCRSRFLRAGRNAWSFAGRMAGGDLHVAQADVGVEHGGHKACAGASGRCGFPPRRPATSDGGSPRAGPSGCRGCCGGSARPHPRIRGTTTRSHRGQTAIRARRDHHGRCRRRRRRRHLAPGLGTPPARTLPERLPRPAHRAGHGNPRRSARRDPHRLHFRPFTASTAIPGTAPPSPRTPPSEMAGGGEARSVRRGRSPSPAPGWLPGAARSVRASVPDIGGAW